ncbi:MAG TPA: D-alanyl-D-alanine carboxypeptidase [Gammaproteobacteria bacterium]|nr:D-alanyl-D-alanine carboxypeptidase [Gammaproteobacteria bacterium]
MFLQNLKKSLLKSIPILCCLVFTAQGAVVVPKAPKIPVKSYVLIEGNTGKMIAKLEENKHIQPASINKLMTAYSTFLYLDEGQISLDDKVMISNKAWKIGGSSMFIDPSMKLTVGELLQGMIVVSGNDASIALAEHLAGSEDTFVEMMNIYAESIGMENTHYVNATGLDHEEQYTSALDIGLLASEIINKYPEYYRYYSQKSFTFDGIKQYNRNKLLSRDESVDGMKTGYTSSAGYCLVASAQRDSMRLIAVVIGADNDETRTDSAAALLNYGFRFFENKKVVESNKEYATAKVWKGKTDQITLGTRSDVTKTIPKGAAKNFATEIEIYSPIVAPVDPSQALGKMTLKNGKEVVVEAPLYPMSAIAKGSIWRQIYDSVWLRFE